VQRWANKWKKEDVSIVPSSAVEELCAFHADLYPNVYILLTILGTLPGSTATSERSYSQFCQAHKDKICQSVFQNMPNRTKIRYKTIPTLLCKDRR